MITLITGLLIPLMGTMLGAAFVFLMKDEMSGHLHNHVGLTVNFDQSENEEFLVNDSP